MKYQVFITTCLKSQINALNRVLLDIHEEDADYLGDGVFASQASSFMYPKTPFQEAVKRYGTDAFVKSILFESNYYEEVNDKFKELVTYSDFNTLIAARKIGKELVPCVIISNKLMNKRIKYINLYRRYSKLKTI